jgi:non-specific serine/threonine protein kinase
LLLNNLARVARDLEEWEHVAALCAESLALFEELGDRHGIVWVLSNLTVVSQRRGAWEQAARLHGAAEALREAVGSAVLTVSPAEVEAYQTAIATARAHLGEDAFSSATAAGRAMPVEEVAAWTAAAPHGSEREETAPARVEASPSGAGRGSGPDRPAPSRPVPPPGSLTRREREVAALVAQGLTDRQIAETLVIAEGTVGVHLANIFTKLDLHARAQLAVWAAEHGLLPSRGE